MRRHPSLGNKLELIVLHSVAQLKEGASGSEIRRHVNTLQEHEYSVGAIYTTLSRLEEKGFAVSKTTEPLPVRGGRSRRLYSITGIGQAALADAEAFARGIWRRELGTQS